jgi:hypothetical protein
MQLRDCPVPVYGDTKFRGACPKEEIEQVTFFNRLRRVYPDTYGLIALHPRNEQQLKGSQHRTLISQKAEGMTKGAADIIIPGAPTFVCEMKRRDHTLSTWQDGQTSYLVIAEAAGSFACVALGADAAWEAFEAWIRARGCVPFGHSR